MTKDTKHAPTRVEKLWGDLMSDPSVRELKRELDRLPRFGDGEERHRDSYIPIPYEDRSDKNYDFMLTD